MNTPEGTPQIINFSAVDYRVTRHAATFTVDPVAAPASLTALVLEMALEMPARYVTDALVEKLAKEASPYAARMWRKIPAVIREHYRTLARAALMATRELLAQVG